MSANMRTVLSSMGGKKVTLWLVGHPAQLQVTVKAMGDTYVTVESNGGTPGYIALEHIVAVWP